MAKKTHHVTHNTNGGWDVKRGSSDRSSKHFDNKQDAVDWGREVSRHQNSEFVIHGRNGRIQQSEKENRYFQTL